MRGHGHHVDLHRRPGRPRDGRVDDAVRAAAVELLATCGWSGLTIDAVAARAGVGKAAIYRRWESKEALLLDATRCMAIAVPEIDTGQLRTDLIELFGGLAANLAGGSAGQVMPAVIAEAAVNPQMRGLLTAMVDERRMSGRALLQRGLQRGELAGGTDIELLLDMLSGPVFYRHLVSGSATDSQVIESLVDKVLAAHAVTPPAAASRRPRRARHPAGSG
jgi:AcrR family transcriptional regulator